MQSPTIVSLNNNTVSVQIQNWLINKGKRSVQTRRNYEGWIRKFFGYTRNLPQRSEIESLSPTMLEYTHHEIVAYQNYLTDVHRRPDGEIVGATVNSKMAAIKSLFKYLSIDNPSINMNIFNAVERMKDNPESYGWLTPEEVFRMCELALELENGYEKSILIELAARTGIRVQALLNVEKDDVIYRNNYWYICALDKGQKKAQKPIPVEMYVKLKVLIDESDNQKLFHMSPSTAERTVADLVKEMGLDEKRNITFHSLKKTGIMYELLTTGNIHTASLHGGHSDPRTTMKHYAHEFDNPSIMPGVRMGIEMNDDVIPSLSLDEWQEIYRTLNPASKLDILNKAKQLRADSSV